MRLATRLKRWLGRLGRAGYARLPVEVFRRQPAHHYVPDLYGYTAYKNIDIFEVSPFGELAHEVRGHGRTYLYFDKLHVIYQALANVAPVVPDGEPLTIADVGTFQGGSAYFAAAVAEALHRGPARLHCFDTFGGAVAEDIDVALEPLQERTRQRGHYEETSVESVRAYLARFPDTVIHVGRIQDTWSEVSTERFAFVHLDINLFEPTRAALDAFGPRMVPGGTIVVDDYGTVSNPGVRKAVDEFYDPAAFIKFHLLTNQSLLIRR